MQCPVRISCRNSWASRPLCRALRPLRRWPVLQYRQRRGRVSPQSVRARRRRHSGGRAPQKSHHRGRSSPLNSRETAQRTRRTVRISALVQEAHSGSWGDGDACPDNDIFIQGFIAHALDVLAYAHILYHACIPRIVGFGFGFPSNLQSSLPSCIPPHSYGALFASHLHCTNKLSHGRIRRSFVLSPRIPYTLWLLFRVDGSPLCGSRTSDLLCGRSSCSLRGLAPLCEVMATAHLYYSLLSSVAATVASQYIRSL